MRETSQADKAVVELLLANQEFLRSYGRSQRENDPVAKRDLEAAQRRMDEAFHEAVVARRLQEGP